jgi:prenylcysteine oxidase/farnesylcysteine lyase
MVATAPEGAMSVAGGNWQIFHNMVKASGAYVLQNTSVASIAVDSKDAASSRPKYILETTSSNEAAEATIQTQPVSFDDVVVATPYQFSKISAADGIFENPIDEIPYIKLHVTIFASPFRLSAAYFKVPRSQVPSTVLTTLPEGGDPTSGVQGAGKAGFYSISTLKRVVNPKTGGKEYLYKIFSPEKVTPDFLRCVYRPVVSGRFIL